MDNSDGLKAEAKALDACRKLQSQNRSYGGYSILKVVRTFDHKEYKIRRLESKKIDLIIVFKNPNGHPVAFVLQIKSTEKSYKHFCNSSKSKKVKCLLVLERESVEEVMKKIKKIFEEIIYLGKRKNIFFRRNISMKLI